MSTAVVVIVLCCCCVICIGIIAGLFTTGNIPGTQPHTDKITIEELENKSGNITFKTGEVSNDDFMKFKDTCQYIKNNQKVVDSVSLSGDLEEIHEACNKVSMNEINLIEELEDKSVNLVDGQILSKNDLIAVKNICQHIKENQTLFDSIPFNSIPRPENVSHEKCSEEFMTTYSKIINMYTFFDDFYALKKEDPKFINPNKDSQMCTRYAEDWKKQTEKIQNEFTDIYPSFDEKILDKDLETFEISCMFIWMKKKEELELAKKIKIITFDRKDGSRYRDIDNIDNPVTLDSIPNEEFDKIETFYLKDPNNSSLIQYLPDNSSINNPDIKAICNLRKQSLKVLKDVNDDGTINYKFNIDGETEFYNDRQIDIEFLTIYDVFFDKVLRPLDGDECPFLG
tara:strand:+ start:10400 stop:11593 length:1194 start_codon:yes stop_codon:yes gene_type:complete